MNTCSICTPNLHHRQTLSQLAFNNTSLKLYSSGTSQKKIRFMEKLQTTRKRQQIPPPEKKKSLPDEPLKKQIQRSPPKSKDEPTVRGTALSLNESRMPMSSDVFLLSARCSLQRAASCESKPQNPKTKTSHLVFRPYGMPAQILATHFGAKNLAALRVS